MVTADTTALPRTAGTLVAHAELHGWTASPLTLSHGPWGITVIKDAQAHGVRIRRRGEHLFVLWIDGKFHAGFSARLQHFPTLRALRAYLAEPS